jgi:serine-type D-Ala-D-Ala carboxypeptidase
VKLSEISGFLNHCRSNKIFPSASVAVCNEDKTVFAHTGFVRPDDNVTPVDENSLYDVASITKPIATAAAILILYDRSVIDIDKPVKEYLIEFEPFPDKYSITIRHLLTHASGFPAWLPLYQFCASRPEMTKYLAGQTLSFCPGSKVEYSCLGYILLAEIVSRLTDMSLDKFCKTFIFQPLQMNHTTFNPTTDLNPNIVPTEKGNFHEYVLAQKAGYTQAYRRNYLIQGEVHDSNAFAAGGEGGNAGLFSTASDLIRFCKFLLKPDSFPLVLSPSLLAIAVSNQTPSLNAQRGFGWQMASSSSATRNIFPDNAYGHNGFTGTSIWIDPVNTRGVVFLSNRVYYQEGPADFNSVRAQLHRSIAGH